MSINSKLASLKQSVFGLDRETRIRNYLNNSVSIYDLERRQREIEQGKFRGL